MRFAALWRITLGSALRHSGLDDSGGPGRHQTSGILLDGGYTDRVFCGGCGICLLQDDLG